MKPISVKYPFVPKSNRSLIPGQFWAIPLYNGSLPVEESSKFILLKRRCFWQV
ncbi:hypothetical protein LEP1GSC038_4747 [Leptospira weilii str. 2006001855]|uniref:Uncharacterized protein n=1 Tax=Leptospira weilii str. 2006001855 TaxID=996804 RepID=M6FT14_9LEPT|nr:hypothetical protein LEP1GSC038_4747 [Leptospira weilii str. 2006001855]